MLPLIVDAHEDIAYNILNFGRDYTRAAAETRRIETGSGSKTPEHNGETLLGWPDYQRGRVAVVFGTLFRQHPSAAGPATGKPRHMRISTRPTVFTELNWMLITNWRMITRTISGSSRREPTWKRS